MTITIPIMVGNERHLRQLAEQGVSCYQPVLPGVDLAAEDGTTETSYNNLALLIERGGPGLEITSLEVLDFSRRVLVRFCSGASYLALGFHPSEEGRLTLAAIVCETVGDTPAELDRWHDKIKALPKSFIGRLDLGANL